MTVKASCLKVKPAEIIIIALLLTGMLLAAGPQGEGAAARELNLAESIEIALENNPGFKASQEELRALQPTVDMAEAARFPSISLTTSYVRMGGDAEEIEFDLGIDELDDELDDFLNEIFAEAFEPPDSIFQTEFTLQQPVFTFGRISRGIEQAEAAYQAGEAGFSGERQELIHEVITTYHDVILSREMVDFQQDVREQVQAHKDVVRTNLEAGLVTELDLHEARVALLEVEQELMEAESGLELAREGFRSLLGLERGTGITLADSGEELLDELEEGAVNLAGAEDYLDLSDNPGLEQFHYQQEASEAGLNLAEAERFPVISLMGNYSWEDEDFGFEDSSWSLAVNVSLDIFDGGQRRAEIEQAEAELRQLEYVQEEMEDGLRLEAKRAISSLQDARSRQELAAERLAEARSRVDLAELRYAEGVGTSTDVLNARTDKNQARLAELQAEFSRIEAVADIYLVLGEADKLFEVVHQ